MRSRRAAIALLLAAWLVALLAVGSCVAPWVASAAQTRPSIAGFRYTVSQGKSGQRVLTISAVVRGARRCFVSSPGLTDGHKRAVACSGRGSDAHLHVQLALGRSPRSEGFETLITIEASGPGGTAKARFKVKVASEAPEHPGALEPNGSKKARQRRASSNPTGSPSIR